MSDLQVFNGVAYSWPDIAVEVQIRGGKKLADLTWSALKSSNKLQIGKRKSGGRVVGRTTGSREYSASGEMASESWEQFVSALVMNVTVDAAGVKRYGNPVFDIVMQYQTPGQVGVAGIRKLKSCRIMGDDEDRKEGDDPNKTTFEMDVLDIVNVLPDGTEVGL